MTDQGKSSKNTSQVHATTISKSDIQIMILIMKYNQEIKLTCYPHFLGGKSKMLIKKQTRGKLQKNKYFDNKRHILGEIKSIFRSFFKCFPLVKYKKIANTSL